MTNERIDIRALAAEGKTPAEIAAAVGKEIGEVQEVLSGATFSVEDDPNALRGPKGDTGDTGPAAWAPVVAWDNSTAYVTGPPASVVTDAGHTYVCKVPNTNARPSTDAGAHWTQLV